MQHQWGKRIAERNLIIQKPLSIQTILPGISSPLSAIIPGFINILKYYHEPAASEFEIQPEIIFPARKIYNTLCLCDFVAEKSAAKTPARRGKQNGLKINHCPTLVN